MDEKLREKVKNIRSIAGPWAIQYIDLILAIIEPLLAEKDKETAALKAAVTKLFKHRDDALDKCDAKDAEIERLQRLLGMWPCDTAAEPYLAELAEKDAEIEQLKKERDEWRYKYDKRMGD